MDRSIRKSIHKNEIEYILTEQQRAIIIPALFNNPNTLFPFYLLKQEIKDLILLKDKISSLNFGNDLTQRIMKIFEIQNDLNIPLKLQEVFNNQPKIAFFVGAGVSKILGIPLWHELSDKAIDFLKEKQYINYSETTKLRSEKLLPKQILSILHRFLEQQDNELKNFYKENFIVEKSINQQNPYHLLFELEKSLGKQFLKITTNIDTKWENSINNNMLVTNNNFDENSNKKQNIISKNFNIVATNFSDLTELNTNSLYKIHGTLFDIETEAVGLNNLVITTSQYVEAYREEKKLKGFLSKVFKEYAVIFIGSSMQEFEILEHILKQSGKHYAIVGTNIGEENLFRLKEKYFEDINIIPIPYYLDFQGYDRLNLLLEQWIEQIKSLRKDFYNTVQKMDEVEL